MRNATEVKAGVRLSDIISQRVKLIKDGREFKALCPFHGEKSPSFTVNDAKRWYHCFGCGAHGDVFDFLSEFYGMDLNAAISYLTGEQNHAALKPVRDLPPPQEHEEVASFVKILPTTKAPELMDGERTGSLWNPKRRGTDKEFTTLRPSAVYEYRSAAGDLLGYVLRVEFPDGGKFTPTVQWCRDLSSEKPVAHWTLWPFAEPRPLYGLETIEATDETVIVVEGEKCADALSQLTGVAGVVPVVTWPQGSSNYHKADWTPLAGKNIIVWPDNDPSGHNAVYGQLPDARHPFRPGIIHLLRDAGAKSIRVIVPPKGKPKGWDVADAIEAGENVQEIIASAGPVNPDDFAPKPGENAQNDAPDAQKQHEDARKGDNYAQNDKFADAPFRFLGYNHDTHYFITRKARQVFHYTGRQLRDTGNLIQLAPLNWWEKKFVSDDGAFTGMRVTYAANLLTQRSFDQRVFTPDRLRGRGVWMEGGVPVAHLGDRVIAAGQPVGIYDYESSYIYEQHTPITADIKSPLQAREAHELLKLCQRLNWEKPIYAHLLAGWIALAPVCGALDWRPHIWLTAPAGAGKSWVMDRIIKRCAGDFGIHVRGASTEAGLRKLLKADARPILFDEAEAETENASANIRNVLGLMRGSSSAGGGTAKGGADGGIFEGKTMFAFASIGVSVKSKADQGRVTILSLLKNNSPEAQKEFETSLAPAVASLLTDEYASRLRGRSITLLPVLRQNYEIFRVIAGNFLKDARVGDQIGALLAGAYLLHSDKPVSPDKAREWVAAQDWNEQVDITKERDELALLQHIAQTTLRFEYDGRMFERSIGELLAVAASDPATQFELNADANDKSDSATFSNRKAIHAILNRHGLKIEDMAGDLTVVGISSTHKAIYRILRDTPFSVNWGKVLQRVDGAFASQGATRFGNMVTRCVYVPISEVILFAEVPF